MAAENQTMTVSTVRFDVGEGEIVILCPGHWDLSQMSVMFAARKPRRSAKSKSRRKSKRV